MMPDKNQSGSRGKDEIDLLDLFSKFGIFIKNCFLGLIRLILGLVFFIIRKWLPLSVSILLGISLSFITSRIIRPYYVSDMVFRTNAIPNSEMIPYLNKLHQYCLENNSEALINAFSGIDYNPGTVVDIEAFWVIDLNKDYIPDYVDYKNKHNVFDTLNVRMTDRFAVQVKVRETSDFSLLRDGIIAYINGNPAYVQRNQVRLDHYEETFSRLEYDINQLDSLQEVKYFEETRRHIPANGGQIVFLQEQKTQLIYEDIHNLSQEKQALDREKKLFDEIVTLLNDYTPTSNPKNDTLFYCKIIVPLLFSLTLIFLLINTNREKLRSFILG